MKLLHVENLVNMRDSRYYDTYVGNSIQFCRYYITQRAVHKSK